METDHIRKHQLLGIMFGLLFSIVHATTVFGCNIPVFRFALERWQSDLTEIVVFVHGTPTNADQTKIERLRLLSSGTDGQIANLRLTIIDLLDTTRLETEYKAYRELWDSIVAEQESLVKGQGTTEAFAVVRTRIGKDKVVTTWQGQLQNLKADQIPDSPVRQELSRRLLAGDSVVWLVLRSKDQEKSDRFGRDLKEQLGKLAESLQLPDGVGLPGSELYSEVPLFMKFTVLEIDPADPNEWFLIESLSRLEPRFHSEQQPLVVPVFGKGRALEVMAASDVSPELIEDLTRFLCSACSCQVKELNPGFDLVMKVQWNLELFGEESAPEMAAPAKTGAAGSTEPALIPIPSGRPGRK